MAIFRVDCRNIFITVAADFPNPAGKGESKKRHPF